jgi:hypothetical protein
LADPNVCPVDYDESERRCSAYFADIRYR